MADNEKNQAAGKAPRYGPDIDKSAGRVAFGLSIIAACGCMLGVAALYFLDDRVGYVERGFNRVIGKFKKKASP